MKLYRDYLNQEMQNKKKAEDEKTLREYGEDIEGSPIIIYEPDTVVQTGKKIIKGIVSLIIFLIICILIGAFLICAGSKI